MKRNIVITGLISTLFFCTVYTNKVTPSTPRLWDNALANLSQSDVILSKICVIEGEVQADFSGVFTMLDAIDDKTATIISATSIVDLFLDTINTNISTINSKVDVINTELNTIISTVNVIHVNDFGGTWTALNELQTVLLDKLGDALSDVDLIDSKLDILAGVQESHFIDTYTILQSISADELSLLVELNSLSDQLIGDLSQIDQCILMAKAILMTVDSKIDITDVRVDVGFAGTFTVIDSLTRRATTIQSKLDITNTALLNHLIGTYTALAAVQSLLDTVDSKLNVIETEVGTVDSRVDDILLTIKTSDSKIDVINSRLDSINRNLVTVGSKLDRGYTLEVSINDSVNTLLGDFTDLNMKVCTVSSKVDILQSNIRTVSSKVDIFDQSLRTISSSVDAVSINLFNSYIDNLNSRTDRVLRVVRTSSSKIDLLSIDRITLNSTVDYLINVFTTELSKINVIDSKIDNIDSTIEILDSNLDITLRSVRTVSSLVDGVNSKVSIAHIAMDTVESKVDTLNSEVVTLLSKVCFIDSRIDKIDSKIDRLTDSINAAQVQSVHLLEDMNATWTILRAIDATMASVISTELTVSSKLSSFSLAVDLSGVYTAIAVIDSKANTHFPSAVTLDSRIDIYNATCITNLGPTFTAIDKTTRDVCTAESCVEIFITSIEAILSYGGFPVNVPLTPSDFNDTYTITISGRYILQEDVAFNPGSNGFIYIDADDVHINLCGRRVTHVNGNAGVTGIRIANGRKNISIENGILRDFTDGGIVFEGNNSHIRLTGLSLINNDNHQLVINSSNTDNGANNIILRDLLIEEGDGDFMLINKASGIFIFDCLASGTPATNGFKFNACDYVEIKNSSVYNTYGSGIIGSASSNSFGMTNFYIKNCISDSNAENGFCFSGFHKNGVVYDCVATKNANGIRFTSNSGQVYNSSKNCIIGNIASKNTVRGIYIDDMAENNYIAFNEMFLNTGTNLLENTGEGPNSILGNFSFKTTGTGFISGLTTINMAKLRNNASFPSPEPTYWENADMSET